MIHIRPAQKKDLPAVYALVAELAAYEKALAEFTATLADYERAFEEQTFYCQVAEDPQQQEVVGMVLYYLTYSTWKGRMLYLEDFVVKESYRGQGIGQQLFEAFLEAARQLACRLTKWQVLDWNTPAIKFYEQQGALIEKDWWNGKLSID